MSQRPALPEPRIELRRITLPDGRPLIYYEFTYPPAPDARERDPRPRDRHV